MTRPRIPADILVHAIASGSVRVTVARINPADLPYVDLERLHIILRCNVLPSGEVERGFLYVDSVAK